MKWQMVFDLPTSQRQIKYYILRVLCASVVIYLFLPAFPILYASCSLLFASVVKVPTALSAFFFLELSSRERSIYAR